MKKLKFIPLLGLTSVTITGCQLLSPVPSDTDVLTLPGGHSISLVHQKDTIISGFKAEIRTNGSVNVSFESLTATNNPAVIISSYAGQAQTFAVIFNGMQQIARDAYMAGMIAATNNAAKK